MCCHALSLRAAAPLQTFGVVAAHHAAWAAGSGSMGSGWVGNGLGAHRRQRLRAPAAREAAAALKRAPYAGTRVELS